MRASALMWPVPEGAPIGQQLTIALDRHAAAAIPDGELLLHHEVGGDCHTQAGLPDSVKQTCVAVMQLSAAKLDAASRCSQSQPDPMSIPIDATKLPAKGRCRLIRKKPAGHLTRAPGALHCTILARDDDPEMDFGDRPQVRILWVSARWFSQASAARAAGAGGAAVSAVVASHRSSLRSIRRLRRSARRAAAPAWRCSPPAARDTARRCTCTSPRKCAWPEKPLLHRLAGKRHGLPRRPGNLEASAAVALGAGQVRRNKEALILTEDVDRPLPGDRVGTGGVGIRNGASAG